ncbi:MAG TPA: GNAT family N-acetyltransferase [Clostridia bacterium]|nr:GNAT family N-acetyltransferase [Clostridia bacterium]
MNYKEMYREEILRLSEIDRSEVVEYVYYFKNGKLELEKESYDIKAWDKEELSSFINRLYDLHDRQGYIFGAFDGESIAGLVALDNKLFGRNKDQLKLDMLYISSPYRGKGIGRKLMEICKVKAKELGASKFYISATPFKNTVDFYMRMGCKLTAEINKELFELEPYDIHLDLEL